MEKVVEALGLITDKLKKVEGEIESLKLEQKQEHPEIDDELISEAVKIQKTKENSKFEWENKDIFDFFKEGGRVFKKEIEDWDGKKRIAYFKQDAEGQEWECDEEEISKKEYDLYRKVEWRILEQRKQESKPLEEEKGEEEKEEWD
jgi:hypothetical protein